MDYIREFDIRLGKEMYYAGELLQGQVILNTVENFKLRAIRVVVRGKAHAEWKVVVSGDRRTVKDDQYFVDDRTTIWGKDKPEGNVPILPRGNHTFPFRFQLPESSLPCSFESKSGTIRYYIKVTVDIPYASPPQGMKYFTIIGPHIDCMDEQYLKPMVGQDKRALCCLCCKRGPVSLRTQLERTAYVCGESIKLKADIDNQSEQDIRLRLKLVQYVEYFIDRGVLGVSKDIQHPVLEYTGDPVAAGTRWKFDSSQSLVVPVMPPTLIGVCRLLQIYYVLKVNIVMSKAGEDLHMHFPITIATVPFRIPNSSHQPNITYSQCCDHVEGGLYIGPEFQLGQVYDGGLDSSPEAVLLYRPVYVCIPNPKLSLTPAARARMAGEQQQQIHDTDIGEALGGGGHIGRSGSMSVAGSHFGRSASMSVHAVNIGRSGSMSVHGTNIGRSGSMSVHGTNIGRSGSMSVHGSNIGRSGSMSVHSTNIGRSGSMSVHATPSSSGGANIGRSGSMSVTATHHIGGGGSGGGNVGSVSGKSLARECHTNQPKKPQPCDPGQGISGENGDGGGGGGGGSVGGG